MTTATQTRKQREIQEREGLILDVARDIILSDGFAELRMDRLAEATQYSKGTMYQHFPCREEVLLALAVRIGTHRVEMFERASSFDGTTRERMSAIGVAAELFVLLYPEQFLMEQTVFSNAVWAKTSQERQDELLSLLSRCMSCVAGIVRDAVAAEDLRLDENVAPEEIAFALWSLTHGAYTMMLNHMPLERLGLHDPVQTVRDNCGRIMDGYDWRPLNAHHDYEAVTDRIREQIFAQECAELVAAS